MPIRFSPKYFTQGFEPELEQAYQAEWRSQIFGQVMLSIRVAVILNASFIAIDIYDLEITPYGWMPRVISIFFMLIILGFLHSRKEQVDRWIIPSGIALIFVASMVGIIDAGLLTEKEYFLYFTPGFLLTVAYIFGPLAIPIIPGVILSTVIALLFCMVGFHHGVPSSALVETGFDMFAMVFIGAFSRYQLDAFSRQTFLEKRTAQLERAKAESERQVAEQAVRDKTEFLRNASHNLRQPMQALVSYAARLEVAAENGKAGDSGPARLGMLKSVEILATSFNKILDLNKLDSQAPKLENLPLRELLEEIHQQFHPLAQAKGIHLKVVRRLDRPFLIRSDDALLGQILGNLVDNAIKYTPRGWVLVKAAKIGNTIRVHIVDTGHGIAESQQGVVFKEFFRIERPDDVGGFGLGLAYVAKAVARLPGHRLTLFSKVGRGTHIRLEIPLAEQRPIETMRQKTPDVRLLAGKSVLLVEDNRLVLEAIAGHLQDLGMAVEPAMSATEARLILHDRLEAPDLVITDWMLTEGETAERVVACVQSHCGPVPTLVISGEPRKEGMLEVSGQSCPFLNKPVNPVVLVRTLTQMLDIPSKA